MADGQLNGKTVLITAGPTREKIDDVRYISNFSTGKMGFAIAEEAAKFGAKVILIAGPVNIQLQNSEIKRIDVSSAEEMYNQVMNNLFDCDIAIYAAAVADYTPKTQFKGKLKKGNSDLFMLEMTKTKDILAESAKNKSVQIIVGFALESENNINLGIEKLIKKNCDLLVFNSLSVAQSGFEVDNNTISIISRNGNLTQYPNMSKQMCATAILNEVLTLMS